ncbi:MAG: hypothetical protein V3V67_07095 [Myxococcota bacterium]
MNTFDRLLLLALTLGLWALVFGQGTGAVAQERFQATRGFRQAVERVVDELYVGQLVNDVCYVNNGDVQEGAKDDVTYVHC